MAIPVFPAGANVGISPNQIERFNPDPTIYNSGLQAGLTEGTPLSQAVNGLNRGIEIDQNQRANEVNIAAQEQRNQILARSNTPEAIAREERALAFKETQERRLLEAQTLQAKTSAAKQELDIKKFELDSKKESLDVKKNTRALELEEKQAAQKETILDSFNAMDQDNADSIAQGLATLEANKNAIAGTSITQKGKDVSVDPVISSSMQNIVERAKATGDPALVARADRLQKEYFQQVSNAQNIAAGKPITTLGADAPAKALEDGTPEYNLGGGQTIKEKAQPGLSPADDKLYAEAQAIDSKTSLGTSPQQRDRDAIARRQLLREQGVPEAEINKQLGIPVGENATVDEVTYKSKRMDYFRKQRLDQIAASGGDPTSNESQKIAADYANDMYKGNSFSEQQITELGNKTASLSKARADLDRTRTAFERLQQLMQEEGIDPKLGKTQNLGQIKDALTAKVINDPAKMRLIDDVYRSLDASAITGMLATLNEANMGQKLADSNKESERLLSTQVGLDKSLAANLGVLQAATGTAYNREQQLEIMRFAAASNKPYSTAISLIDKYNDISPAVVDGTIDGSTFPVANAAALRGKDFISKYYFDQTQASPSLTNIPKPSDPAVATTPDGRVADAPGISKQDVPKVATEMAEIVSLGKDAFKSTVPPGESVPDKHPDFKPTPALVTRQASVESGGNPWAKNKESSAKGLFQFTDGTGKPLWKELGFEGAYNPYDPEKATAMYQLHMSKLLKQFGGDTRAAVAAHFLGAGTVHRYRDKVDGDTEASWDQVMLRMPDEVPIKNAEGKTITTVPKKDIAKYVEKVMGDDGKAAGTSLAKQAWELYKTGVVKTAKLGLEAMTGGFADVTDEEVASGMKSFGYGMADGYTLGSTGELLALADEETGIQYDRSKAAEISGASDMGMYAGGAVVGAAYSPVMKILGAGARGLGGILGLSKAAEVAPIVSDVVGNTPAITAGLRTAKAGAIGAGITGVMEGDEAGGDWNLGKRALSGVVNAGIGYVGGLVLGSTAQGISNKLNPEAVTDDIARAAVGTKTDALAPDTNGVASTIAAMDTPESTLLNSTKSQELVNTARQSIGNTPGAGPRVAEAAAKIDTTSTNRMTKAIGSKEGSNLTDTGSRAAKAVKGSQDAIVQYRRNTADLMYTAAEESIPDKVLKEPIETATGEVISSYKALTSPEVSKLIKNPAVQREIAAVRSSGDAVGANLPDDSFTILDQVRRSLTSGAGHSKSDRSVLAKKLTSAMIDEVDGYGDAIRSYEKLSRLTDTATKGKAFSNMAKLADEQKTRNVADFGKTLFANDTNAISKMTKLLDSDALLATQEAASTYVDDLFRTTGDIPRDILPKLDVLFGKGTGAKLEQELIAYSAQQTTAKELQKIANISPVSEELYSDFQKSAQGAPLVTRAGSVIRAAFKTVADLIGNDKSISPQQVDEIVNVLSDNKAGKEFLTTVTKKFGEKNATAMQSVLSNSNLDSAKKAEILGQLFGETELTTTE